MWDQSSLGYVMPSGAAPAYPEPTQRAIPPDGVGGILATILRRVPELRLPYRRRSWRRATVTHARRPRRRRPQTPGRSPPCSELNVRFCPEADIQPPC